MKKYLFLFLFFILCFNVYAFPDGVYPVPSTRQEVEPGIFIIQGTDGRWYQETIPEEDEDITYLSLTGKYDSIFEAMQKFDDFLGKPVDVPNYDSTPVDNSKYKSDPVIDNNYLTKPELKGLYYLDQYQYKTDGTLYYRVIAYFKTGNFVLRNGKTELEVSCLYQYSINGTTGESSFFKVNNALFPSYYDRYNIKWTTNYYVDNSNNTYPGMGSLYTGYGNPDLGIDPGNDINNPDADVYVPVEEREPVLPTWVDNTSLFGVLGNILNAIKYNTAIVIHKSDLVISQLELLKNNPGLIVPENDDLNITDVDFTADINSNDNWFVKLLKAIAKFLSSLIVPGDVITYETVSNSDGSTSTVERKTNYFVYNFKDMTNNFSQKFGYEQYTNKLTNLTLTSNDSNGSSSSSSSVVLDDSIFGGYISLDMWKPYLPQLQDYIRGFIYCMLVIYNVKMVQFLIRATSPIKSGKED